MAASLAEVVQTPGMCFVCGCQETSPCPTAGGGPCSWMDAQRTVCSSCVHELGAIVIEYLLNEVCGTRAEQQEPSRLVLP